MMAPQPSVLLQGALSTNQFPFQLPPQVQHLHGEGTHEKLF